MKIKKGYNDKDAGVVVIGRDIGTAEIWLIQDGLEGKASETLAYATLEEVVALRNECNEAIKKMTGL